MARNVENDMTISASGDAKLDGWFQKYKTHDWGIPHFGENLGAMLNAYISVQQVAILVWRM